MGTSTEHPYSLAREQDGIVYVSGAAAIDYDIHEVVPGRREALDAALRAVEDRLGTVGLDLSHVVKMTYYLTDVSLRDEANEQFREHFGGLEEGPARTVVAVPELPYDAVAVIDATAHR